MFKALWQLPRTVWLIGLISLLNDSASEMLYPLVPLYLSSVLMAGPKALGLIEGVAEATASLLKLFSGIIMDRTGRAKPWIVVGYGLAGAGRPLIALATHWGWVLAIRFADRIGKGLRTSPRDALLAASVAPEHRGLAFGLHRALDNGGAVVGPLVAASLLGAHMPLREIFAWAAVPGILCVILALMIREQASPASPPASAQPAQPVHGANSVSLLSPQAWRFHALPLVLRRYLVVVALFTLGNSSNMFLLLRAKELGVPDAQIPLLWAAVSAVAMLFATPLSAWSDKVGRLRVLMGGYFAYALFYMGMGWATDDGWLLLAMFAFYGLFLAATEGVEKALVADLTPPDQRGRGFGWFNLTTGAMLLPASMVFGWLYQTGSPKLAFGFSGGCALAAAALLATWVKAR